MAYLQEVITGEALNFRRTLAVRIMVLMGERCYSFECVSAGDIARAVGSASIAFHCAETGGQRLMCGIDPPHTRDQTPMAGLASIHRM